MFRDFRAEGIHFGVDVILERKDKPSLQLHIDLDQHNLQEIVTCSFHLASLESFTTSILGHKIGRGCRLQ